MNKKQTTSPELHCRVVVQRLMKRYQWQLLLEQAFVTLVANAIQGEQTPTEIERLARSIYARVLYVSCCHTEPVAVRERAYQEVFNYLHQMAWKRWPDLAEEVSQRALTLVFEQIDRVRNPRAFLSFVTYKLLAAYKAECRLVEAARQDIPLEAVEDYTTTSPINNPQRTQREQQHAIVMTTLSRILNPKQQRVIQYTFFEELDSQAISLKMKLTPGNVRTIRHRALARLQAEEVLMEVFH